MNTYNNYPYGPNYTGPTYGANNGYSYPNQSTKPQLQQYAFVNGVEEAKGYSMGPNQTILLMDKNSPVCYMKSSDNFGQYSLKYFKLDEIDEVAAKEITDPRAPQPDFASKEDFDILNKKIDDLMKLLGKSQNRKEQNNG